MWLAGWLAKGIIISTIVLGSGVAGGSIGYLTNKEEKQEPPTVKIETITNKVEKTKQTIRVPKDFSFCRWLHWNNWTKDRKKKEHWCKKQMEKEYIIVYK
ncbi:hypothetical protein A6V39_01180 [Candidatus Mycoplasma haematobovis]|uniref:Uncharacterized protein n=1 Tax=Candidatus Mycoplasma haematobovis TaxID=432608 RepID=A0A1A9QFE4_9MOLU|nr:hypothetical protein [Candidatus Mycoplasma haematobovis]OAL10666.1 hypothetical protein A6V39_01180 [Candidatus Mycoplasma haematobovis]